MTKFTSSEKIVLLIIAVLGIGLLIRANKRDNYILSNPLECHLVESIDGKTINTCE